MMEDWNTTPKQPEGESTTAKCDRLLKHFKWQFGNDSHIALSKRVHQLTLLRRQKKPSKTEIERIEKIIISSIEYDQKKNL